LFIGYISKPYQFRTERYIYLLREILSQKKHKNNSNHQETLIKYTEIIFFPISKLIVINLDDKKNVILLEIRIV